MKKLSLLALTLFFSAALLAQGSNLSKLSAFKENGNWIKMLPDSRVAADQFFETFLLDLGLDENYHFELIKKATDQSGITHYRYQEYFTGYPVEGGVYILHEKDGFVANANGKLIRGIPDNSQVSISVENGLTIAKGTMDSEKFYWEIPGMEALLKRIKKDPNATFYPAAELVYAQAQFAGNGEKYRPARKYELYGANPEQKKTVFVDAQSGAVLFALEGLHSGSVEGTAETRYHGLQTLITDSVSTTEYHLRDATRGGGVETYDMNENINDYSLAVDFTDEDNYWDNANTEMDDAATDAHWAAEMFYDYFLQEHDRNSYDGNGGIMITYIHYDQALFNAYWNGLVVSTGDGNNNPLTTIDVIAHEFTHGLTQYSANLPYIGEPGALNESFSDIFGTAVEFFALGDYADWKIGTADFIGRDMSNPNAYNDPDTYQGDYWHTGTSGDGGAHDNSGVQNFWFYLLSNGGSGVNDNGDAYTVDSLGIEIAAAIAFRNLTVYLTPGSDYFDARYGAIQAAEDLYGACSDISREVREAWYAVGVGPETIEPDFQATAVLSPFTSCDLGSEEQVSLSFRLNATGCDTLMEFGDQIEISYQIDDQDPIIETFTLSETPVGGDMITYNFQTPADFSAPGEYVMEAAVNYPGDLFSSNNMISSYRITKTVPIEAGNKLTFESEASSDTLYKVLGANAIGIRSPLAENTGYYGYQMNSFNAMSRQITQPPTEAGNFTANPDFVSGMYMCVDLTDWDQAFLSFDLRQTYSPYYQEGLAMNIAYMIAARVTANGQQIADQFHPQTNNSDPYLTHVLDMSNYAGTSFTLCFESVNFLNSSDDPYNIGDMATLDNIFFYQPDATGVDDITQESIDIYPNPSTGMLNIVPELSGMYDLHVVDLMGKTVKEKSFMSNGSSYVLDLSNLVKGIYVVRVRSESVNFVKKIVLE